MRTQMRWRLPTFPKVKDLNNEDLKHTAKPLPVTWTIPACWGTSSGPLPATWTIPACWGTSGGPAFVPAADPYLQLGQSRRAGAPAADQHLSQRQTPTCNLDNPGVLGHQQRTTLLIAQHLSHGRSMAGAGRCNNSTSAFSDRTAGVHVVSFACVLVLLQLLAFELLLAFVLDALADAFVLLLALFVALADVLVALADALEVVEFFVLEEGMPVKVALVVVVVEVDVELSVPVLFAAAEELSC